MSAASRLKSGFSLHSRHSKMVLLLLRYIAVAVSRVGNVMPEVVLRDVFHALECAIGASPPLEAIQIHKSQSNLRFAAQPGLASGLVNASQSGKCR